MGILFTSVNLPLDKLQASSEMEINRNLQALSASYRVFKGNYDELVHHLDHLNDPTESLFMYSYQWLTERQTQLHQPDFENLQKMKDELTS
jgi:hypothetical protein